MRFENSILPSGIFHELREHEESVYSVILNMKSTIILLLNISLIGSGCKSKYNHNVKTKDTAAPRYAKYPTIGSETDIQKLIGRIDSSDCVYIGGIGYAGEENEVYDCYQRLLEIAPDSIWSELSYNKNPILRTYAFKAFQDKKSLQLRDVKERLQKDEATICYVSGDVSATYPVSLFVSTAK